MRCLGIRADSPDVRPPSLTRAAVAALAAAAAVLALPSAAGALALSITTGSPQDVRATTATLRAKVSVSALGASVTWQYGTTTAYGATSAAVSSGLLGVDQTLTVGVSGLAPDTTYHVRAVATSGLTTAYGRDVKFNTGNGNSGPGGSGDDDDDGGATPAPAPAPAPTASTTVPATTVATPAATAKGPQASLPGRTPTPIPSDDDTIDGIPAATDGATVAPGVATAAVTPVLGKTLGAAAVQGTVTATSPSGAAVDLSAAKAVPTGTLIDARSGTVELKTALDRRGATQTGHFWGGLFEVRQRASARGLTQIVLRGGDFSACKATNKAVASKATKKKRKPKPRSLWGSDDHGRFQTRGRGSVATVRGTHWLTQDSCAGTLTRVLAGAVAVKDLRGGRTVTVTRGHQYLARMTP